MFAFHRVTGGCEAYTAKKQAVSLLREPDTANPHVRFDERGVETEAWWDQ